MRYLREITRKNAFTFTPNTLYYRWLGVNPIYSWVDIDNLETEISCIYTKFSREFIANTPNTDTGKANTEMG